MPAGQALLEQRLDLTAAGNGEATTLLNVKHDLG
jgi:hypothetical protein